MKNEIKKINSKKADIVMHTNKSSGTYIITLSLRQT